MALSETLAEPLKVLKNRTFAKLYFAETISLLGNAVSWVGLALLAYQLDADRSAVILSAALTLRVFAFVIFSPFAGVLADRIDRRKILYTTHFIRMAVISCFPFIVAEWQIYLLVFVLNMFGAFFTPTYRSTIPLVVTDHYRQAVGLSTSTFQILGILGPGLAGIFAVWLGARDIFFINTVTFAIAGVLILSLKKAEVNQEQVVQGDSKKNNPFQDIWSGISLLFGNKILRFALSIEFISALAGAQILVNTVGHVKSDLGLTDKYYGWLMAAFGIGAAIAAFVSGAVDKSKNRSVSLIAGSLVISFAILFANCVPYSALLVLWVFAGLGQSLAEIPSETLIGETIESKDQGKVYGSHFAFSHLWWAIAYPIAGFLGNNYPNQNFLYGGLLALGGCGIAIYIFKRKNRR